MNMGKGVDVEKSIQTWWSTDQKIKELKEKIKEDEKHIKLLNKEHKEQEQTIIQEMLIHYSRVVTAGMSP